MSAVGMPSAEAVINWSRRALPETYASEIEAMIDDAADDDQVTGLLLTGSVARRDALPGTDIDVRYVVRSAAAPSFTSQLRNGLVIEATVTTEEQARKKLLDNPMQVYAYLDGVVLYDPGQALARLRITARDLYGAFRTPKATKGAMAAALSHAEDKVRVALAAGDLLKCTYSLATVTWQLIEGLWAANDLPLPPNASVRPHLQDLQGPDDIPALFERLFLADPEERARTGLFLLAWVREELTTATPNQRDVAS